MPFICKICKINKVSKRNCNCRKCSASLRQLDLDEISIINDYIINKLTTTQIALKYNIGATTVDRVLKKNNIKCRGRIEYKNKYYHNDNIFNSDNKNIPYWIGFLLTDGCVHKYREKERAPRIILQLKEEDKKILEEYKSFLEYQGPIFQDKLKRWTVQINSYQIAKDLEKFNIIPNKTFIAKAPSLFEYNHLFWRGVLDGDGSIYFQDDRIIISLVSASFNLIEQFQKYCNNILNNESKTSLTSFITKQNNEIFRIFYCGKFAIKILDKIYSEDGPKLERKYNRYINSKRSKYALV
jgi:hypothetical protein